MGNDFDETFLSIDGESAATFEKIFMKYQPILLYFINGFIKDLETSKDICQNIFFMLWRDRKKLSAISSLDTYLFFIAKGAVCNFFDHEVVSDKYISHILHSPIETDDSEERLFANELENKIRQTIKEMPQKRRLIFYLSRDKRLSNQEIAERLNISRRTVENHLTSALADIRKSLKLILLMFFCV